MCPVPLCCYRFDDHHPGARSPVAVTPHLVGRASLWCQGLSPLRTPWWSHLELPKTCVCRVRTQVSVVSFSVNHKLSFQCLGFKFADISVPLPHQDCGTKNRYYTNWKLRLYSSHQLCWAFFFSSSHNQVPDSCCMENCCSPYHLWKTRVNEQASCHLQQCPVAPLS